MTEKTEEQIAEEQAAKQAAAEQKAAEKAEKEAAKAAEKEEKRLAKEQEKAERAAKREEEREAKRLAKEQEKEAKRIAKEEEKARKEEEKERRKAEREANRMPEQNGIRRPKPHTLCGQAWEEADRLSSELGQPVPIAVLLEHTDAKGLHPGNVKAEYARWRKFNGVTGRVALPKAEKEAAEGSDAGDASGTPAAE